MVSQHNTFNYLVSLIYPQVLVFLSQNNKINPITVMLHKLMYWGLIHQHITSKNTYTNLCAYQAMCCKFSQARETFSHPLTEASALQGSLTHQLIYSFFILPKRQRMFATEKGSRPNIWCHTDFIYLQLWAWNVRKNMSLTLHD